ncbi:MAG: hydrogenase maturation protease [Candidatus Omnitrophica bacterium]|nr:hydrogenase maturation protease [Candidatus Omnitrophota bacterium]MCB9721996.1 hydrogenase maturation protease [Candidatus Omnitrophota bacterium]
MRILIIGYGNPARRDDGIGPCLADSLPADIPGVSVRSQHSVMIEDAATAAAFDVVIFVDASISAPEPFAFETINPEPEGAASSHHVSPELIVHLAGTMYAANLTGYLLAVRGYDFDGFGEQLSPKAAANMEASRDFLLTQLTERRFSAQS